MRRWLMLALVAACAGASPATRPAAPAATRTSTRPSTRPTDRVTAAKAAVAATHDALVQAQKRYDAARAAALAPFHASAEYKALAADVANKHAALGTAREGGNRQAIERDAKAAGAADAALRDAEAAITKQDPASRAAEAAFLAADAAARTARADLKAATQQLQREEDAADPAAKRKREIATAIQLGEFREGMTEAEADQAARRFDDPAAPTQSSVETRPDVTRVVRYVNRRPADKAPWRWVTLQVRGGTVAKVDIVERMEMRPAPLGL